MRKVKPKSVISRLRQSSWSKVFIFLLIINFVNLSANFYEGNILISKTMDMNDPLDTLTELIFEWAMEGDNNLIPDNGTQQDDNSLDKIKLALIEIPGFTLYIPILDLENPRVLNSESVINGHFSSTTPPPDRC